MQLRKILSAAMLIALSASAANGQECHPYAITTHDDIPRAEGGYVQFKIFRVGDTSQTVSVKYYTVPITATPCPPSLYSHGYPKNCGTRDYWDHAGTITFGPEEVQKFISFWVPHDEYDQIEGPETFQLVLEGPGTQAPVTNGIGTIRDQRDDIVDLEPICPAPEYYICTSIPQ